MASQSDLRLDEIGNTYVKATSRFVVSLVVGYGPATGDGVRTAKQALAAALELTRNEGSSGTHWYVYDRKTKTLQMYEQSEFEHVAVP